MNFRATVGLGVAAAILYVVSQTIGAIVAGLILAGQILFWWVLGVGSAALLFIGIMVWKQKETERSRAVDGQYPLQRQRMIDGSTVYVDPNKTISGVIRIDPRIGVQEQAPAGGWELQERYARAVQTTRTLAAITPGDNAMIKTHGAIQQPRLPANVTKILQGREEKEGKPIAAAPVVSPLPALPAIPRQPVTGQQMIANPQKTRLAIGEIVGSGEIAYWDVLSKPMVRVHGVTGGGKTALCLLLVAQAIRHGWEVTILDTRQFKDWGILRSHANVIDARDPDIALAAIKQEVVHYEQRDAVLGKYQAADIQQLQRITGKSYRRRLFVVEEVGSHHINAEFTGGKAYRQAFWMALHKLTKDARATGIHGLYIDQMPSNWAEGVRYNSESICFHLPDYGGRVAGYLYAHQLEKYHCHFAGDIIKAGYLTEAQILATIGNAPARVRPFGDGNPGTLTPERTTEPPTETPNPEPLGPTDYQAKAAEMIAKNGEVTQTDLRRGMGISKAYAHELWHALHPNGNNYQLPTLPTERQQQ